MAIEDLLLKPYVLAEWRGADFLTWSLPDPFALWTYSAFSSLAKGKSTLWHHTARTGVFPNQSVDPDFVGIRAQDLVDSSQFSLAKFTSADNWHAKFRVWFRPEHVFPSLGGIEQQAPKVELWAVVGGTVHFIGKLDSPILDPEGVTDSRELSRVEPDAGNVNVGANGSWWYEQILTPKAEVQTEIMGQNPVSLRISLSAGERDATGYGTGIEKVSVEISRGAVPESSNAFPVTLHRSYLNSRRWI